MTTKTHGGKRPGAGRKKSQPTVQIRVYQATAERIKRKASAGKQTVAEVVASRDW